EVVGGVVVSVVDGVGVGESWVSFVLLVVGVVDGVVSGCPPPPKILPMLEPVPPPIWVPVADSKPTIARIATANAATLVPMINGQRSFRSLEGSSSGGASG